MELPQKGCVAKSINDRLTYSPRPINTKALLNQQAGWLLQSGFEVNNVLDYILLIRKNIPEDKLENSDPLYHTMIEYLDTLYKDG
jgi:hypothetical protein